LFLWHTTEGYIADTEPRFASGTKSARRGEFR
jgi:hypothetical protein